VRSGCPAAAVPFLNGAEAEELYNMETESLLLDTCPPGDR
jgi:hypothetical protein